MAVWQFHCNIIPLRQNIDKISRDEMITWKDISQPVIKLEEIDCRLDLRTLTKHNLIQIVKYVQSIGACFLIGNKVYPPPIGNHDRGYEAIKGKSILQKSFRVFYIYKSNRIE